MVVSRTRMPRRENRLLVRRNGKATFFPIVSPILRAIVSTLRARCDKGYHFLYRQAPYAPYTTFFTHNLRRPRHVEILHRPHQHDEPLRAYTQQHAGEAELLQHSLTCTCALIRAAGSQWHRLGALPPAAVAALPSRHLHTNPCEYKTHTRVFLFKAHLFRVSFPLWSRAANNARAHPSFECEDLGPLERCSHARLTVHTASALHRNAHRRLARAPLLALRSSL